MLIGIEELAKRQLNDYDRHQPGGLFAGYPVPMSVDEAYTLQMEVARLRSQRGEPVVGYKIGCISTVMQAQLGLDRPVFGHVFGTELHCSGEVLDPANFDGLAIEGEFAVRIAEDIVDIRLLEHHPERVISSAFAVIELHNYVFRNAPHNAQELIGNNAIHAGVVLPAREQALRDASALLDASIRVSRNGELLGAATGGVLPEGPLGSVLRVAAHLASYGRFLRRGDLVLTGSPLPLYRVANGDRIEVSSGISEAVTVIVSKRASGAALPAAEGSQRK